MADLQSDAIALSTDSSKHWINYNLVNELVKIKALNIPDGKKRAMMNELFIQEKSKGKGSAR